MREILPDIFTWGSTYADRPWDLNGYAIKLEEGTVLIDPPAPEGDDWSAFDALHPTRVILTNRDHVREAEGFRARYGVRIVAGIREVSQLAPVHVDEAVHEGDLVAGALRVIDLPGKSPGEIGLLLEPDHRVASTSGGVLILGDAIIGNPPGRMSLIPEQKLDEPDLLKRSIRKLLAYEFQVLLLCDGQPFLHGGRLEVQKFVDRLGGT